MFREAVTKVTVDALAKAAEKANHGLNGSIRLNGQTFLLAYTRTGIGTRGRPALVCCGKARRTLFMADDGRIGCRVCLRLHHVLAYSRRDPSYPLLRTAFKARNIEALLNRRYLRRERRQQLEQQLAALVHAVGA